MQLLWSNMYPQSELDNYKLQVDLLQEKLKQSEDNRQQLQKELQQILQRRSEHDKSVRTKIRQKYQSFLDEQERRNERNKMLMQMIERIDQQTTALSARSERLKMMKLQYERYFAKLMQAQPMRCIPNAAPTTRFTAEATPITAMTAPTQIPVLLPAVAAQPPTTAPSMDALSGLKSERTTGSMPATATIQQVAGHLEATTEAQSTALTPRMWTFAMATPTPAGLLLSGAPTTTMVGGHGALPTTTTPFEFLQYPLGYGPMMQQPPICQQIPYATATPTGPSMVFGNRSEVPQGSNVDLKEKDQSVLKNYGLTDNTVPTAEAATSTEFPSIVESSTGEISNKQTATIPHSTNRMEENAETEGYTHSSAPTPVNHKQLTSRQSADKLARYQSDNSTSMKAAGDNPATVIREQNPAVNEVVSSLSEVKLEDADIKDDMMSHTDPAVSSEGPKMSVRSSYNFEQYNKKSTSKDDWKEGNIANLSTAEEHRRKIAEIEQRYGTIDAEENNDYATKNMDNDSNQTYTGFKRFSEIVNTKHEPSSEELPTSNENLDNQSWQSHTGSVDDAAMAPTSNVSSTSTPISNSKIDNIENAIYGELVNPQLPETEVTTTRTAAQGFFTELLEQQETPLEDNKNQESKPQEQEYITKGEIETSNLSGDADYANYNPTIESDNTGGLKANNSKNETIDSQNQVTYGTSNQELYQQTNTFTAESAYGTAESANTYAEYPTEQNINPTNPTDSTSDQQQHEEQPDYSQQDYENYDATQYGNYDPNAYPGYIYDETTGQYVVDPQYAAGDANNAEAIYSSQNYTEPQEQQQQQMEYPTDQVQEISYTYEDQAPITTEQSALDAEATPAEVTDVPTSPPAAVNTAVTPAPKVVKPTSILSTTEKHAAQSDAQKKKKRVIFVDSSETDDSSSVKAPAAGAAAPGGESDFDFSSGAETSVG
ncbi:myb-like protein AA [Zeugodacus cucurbitae]|uniref:Uncharacterized protein n=1 Tax=Zeugodacus cucurbitae TaxID=28588 RepID=A0A0A1XKN5_ZEUCU|nr:myb-like protein AA [Zeugodacus cucurbitae]